MASEKPTNGDVQYTRKDQAQIDLIREEFRKAKKGEVEIWPPDWRDRDDGADYLYRAGSVLVRDEDLRRVQELLQGGVPQLGGIGGVTRLELPPGLPEEAPREGSLAQRSLTYADDRLGRGVLTPDHVVGVSPSVSPCPATEPEEVPDGIPPDPLLPTGPADGRGVKVVVLDVGWSDAPGAYWLDGVTGDAETAFDAGTGLIRPYAGHGTFIAGVVRAMARNAEVLVRNYFDTAGAMWEFDLALKLTKTLDDAPDIISLSAGMRTRYDLPSLGLDVFVRNALDRVSGLVLVAAAGNEGDREYFWPAAFPEVVSVGALAENGRDRASFSNFGGWVDVYAPGEDLVNAFLTGSYQCTEPPHVGENRTFDGMARWSGTSFSTPLVAGLIASRMSVTGESARQAADGLLAYALTQPEAGVGPVLRPGDATASLP